MAIAGKILMSPAVLAGYRLRQIAIFGDDADYSVAWHTAPYLGVSLQIREDNGKILAQAVIPKTSAQPLIVGVYLTTPKGPVGFCAIGAIIMPQFLVERHLPGITIDQLTAAAARAKSITSDMTQQGKPVRYLRSTFLPLEEKSFCLFEGPSAELVREANERAELPLQ